MSRPIGAVRLDCSECGQPVRVGSQIIIMSHLIPDGSWCEGSLYQVYPNFKEGKWKIPHGDRLSI